jgi:hypothetical protein
MLAFEASLRAMYCKSSSTPSDLGGNEHRGRWSVDRPPRSLSVVTLILAFSLAGTTPVDAQQTGTPQAASAGNARSTEASATPVLPRGNKLVLKDGSFQLVREYQIQGDRVRYYSVDSGSWEVIPADLVDWDATKKLEEQEKQHDVTVVAKVHTQEAERTIAPLDIDASLEVAPGVFLPAGVNLFVFDQKSVVPMPQAATSTQVSKKRVLEQVMVPIPVVPSRQDVSIQGAHAKFRLHNPQPEFYLRTADSREPNVELLRVKSHGDSRLIEHVDELFGEKQEVRDALPLQKWQVAQGVYRFTLGQALVPGEYALAQSVDQEGTSLYVWDFGVDATSGAK